MVRVPPELLNADIAPLLSVCKKVGIAIEEFPTLNAPDKVVVQATTQRMRMLDMLDDGGQLTPLGRSIFPRNGPEHWRRQGSMESWKGQSKWQQCSPERMSCVR